MRVLGGVFVAATVAFGAGACDEARTPSASLGPSYIIGGTATGDAYPAVGALLFDFDRNGVITGDDQLCTGSLIAPTVFLTAAHCVRSFPPGAQFYVSFSPDLYAASFRYITATGFAYDPLETQSTANPHDLAVIRLPAGSTTGITPLRLPPAGILDALSARGGLNRRFFVNVGYGVPAGQAGIPSFESVGVRQSSRSKFRALNRTWLGLLKNARATGEGGHCFADSGGPKFLDGDATTIYATATWGDIPCRAITWDRRLDTPEARGFLGQFVALPMAWPCCPRVPRPRSTRPAVH